MRALVDPDELAALLAAGDAVAADVRWYLDGRSGRAAFEHGHIPGAVFVDLESVLAGPPWRGPGRHPLPTPEAFAAGLAQLGIGDDDLVVAYDDTGGSIAARLWWLLSVTGHRAAVLDGGIQQWRGELGTGPAVARESATFTARPWPAQSFVDADELAQAVAGGIAVVIDARAGERYSGDFEPIDARPGHIPGAVNAPWSDNLDPATGRFRTADDLRRRYEALGASVSGEVIAYCGSGVTACHDILALDVAGFPRVRLYEGSWSDWSRDPRRAAATGPRAHG